MYGKYESFCAAHGLPLYDNDIDIFWSGCKRVNINILLNVILIPIQSALPVSLVPIIHFYRYIFILRHVL